ncbi:hypothetical protein DV736_g2746, partial [Chaetothyriales sp. CBS 134916]
MASPYTAYGAAFWAVEYRVNGVWNTLLHRFWAVGDAIGTHIISPEAYPRPELTRGLMADLLVSTLKAGPGPAGAATATLSEPVVVYEGKGSNGDTWDQLEDQLESWCSESARLAPFRAWLIGTRGSMVRFYYWADALVSQQWNAARGRPVNGTLTYDIANARQWAIVHAMLLHMSGNRP